jgi:hypothetical protein
MKNYSKNSDNRFDTSPFFPIKIYHASPLQELKAEKKSQKLNAFVCLIYGERLYFRKKHKQIVTICLQLLGTSRTYNYAQCNDSKYCQISTIRFKLVLYVQLYICSFVITVYTVQCTAFR